jgi:cadmium resistance protein CadD (predicted permease)
VFSLEVERDTNYFIFKAIMPLILIVMMSWLVYWIDPSLVASQISVAVTAMLTMIAYRFALAGMIPRLPFLTSLDHFVLASTLMVFLSMIEVVYTAHLSTHDQLEKARMIDRRARWIAPPVYIALLIIIFTRS